MVGRGYTGAPELENYATMIICYRAESPCKHRCSEGQVNFVSTYQAFWRYELCTISCWRLSLYRVQNSARTEFEVVVALSRWRPPCFV